MIKNVFEYGDQAVLIDFGDEIKKEINQNSKDKPIGILNMTIILIISFVAIVIVLDTFRIELSNYIPFLNPMLNSFYSIIVDINSFIKDLIR